jgi:hypothetical protein
MNVQTPFPKEIVGKIDELIQKGVVPSYKSRQDFMRDAVVHRLHYLCQEKDVLADDKQVVTKEMKLCMLHEKMEGIRTYEEIGEQAGEVLSKMMYHRDDEGMAAQVAEIEEMAEDFPEPYRGNLLRVVQPYKK